MHNLELGKFHRKFPEDISELTPDQYHYWIQLNLMLEQAHISIMEMKVLFVYHLLGLKYTGKESASKSENLALIIELLDPFFESNENSITPVLECPINLVPNITVGIRKFKGPASVLADANIFQFLRGLELIDGYQNSQDPGNLVMLMALFYRRKFPNGKVAEFSQKQCERYEKYFARLDSYYLFGFLYFFQSAVKYLTTQEIHLGDGRTYNFSPLFGSKSKGGQSIGPRAVLFALSANSVFGDIEKTGHQNLIEILIYLLQDHYDKEAAKKPKQ